ncbi:MAG: radical SAM protein [bacterium]|nr:radical SAM protein [bacterium]
MSAINDPYFDRAPRIVIWEMTRACALACKHCRAEAVPRRHLGELTTGEAFHLVDEIARLGAPLLVLSGGDPLMRDDIYKIVEYARFRGLTVAVTPSATGRLTSDALERLYTAGAHRVALSLDAPDAQAHDAFRGVRGSYARTLAAVRSAREIGLEVQINTTISRRNNERVDEFVDLLSTLDIALWSVFFLIPVGRASLDMMLDAAETDRAFEAIYAASKRAPFGVKTTEAPAYRRFLAQRDPSLVRTAGIGDGRGFVFVSHVGEVYPSGFLPESAGNVRSTPLGTIYREHPLFVRLRRPSTFTGKCGVCSYNTICGGSRARAYATSGDPFGSDPSCSYVPERSAAHV